MLLRRTWEQTQEVLTGQVHTLRTDDRKGIPIRTSSLCTYDIWNGQFCLHTTFKDLHSSFLRFDVATSKDLLLGSCQADMFHSQPSCCSGGPSFPEHPWEEPRCWRGSPSSQLGEPSRSWWSLRDGAAELRGHREKGQRCHQASDLGLGSWPRGLRGLRRPGERCKQRSGDGALRGGGAFEESCPVSSGGPRPDKAGCLRDEGPHTPTDHVVQRSWL